MKARLTRGAAENLLKAIFGLLKAQGLYPPGHAMVQTAREGLDILLREVFATPAPVLLGVADGYLVVGDVPFLLGSPQAHELTSRFEARRIEGVLLQPGLEVAEAARFCDWLRGGSPTPWSGEEISITRLSRERGAWRRALHLRGAAMEVLEEATREIEEGRVPNPAAARDCVQAFAELLQETPLVLPGLILIKDYDRYTFCHSVNVCVLALALGQQLGMSKAELDHLGLGGLFHDLGKTATPVDVIRKPASLSEDEFAIIRRHPVDGSELLGRMSTIGEPVPRLVLEHHMHYDGGGYPQRAGSPLHPLSQVVAASDIFDAMTSHRPYSPPRPLPEAMDILVRLRGKHLSPAVVDAFVRQVGMVPVGSGVRLRSGEVAVVTRVEGGEAVEVQLVAGRDGREFGEAERILRGVKPADIAAPVNPLRRPVDPAGLFPDRS